MSAAVKISIVTPTFNSGAYLRRTAESVLSQAGAFELQWVIVDGGSTDDTVEVLRSIAATDSRVRWVSEPDRGQSHATNKGVAMADGDVIGWLNGDDLYAPGALDAVAAAFARNARAAWVVGRCEIVDEAGRPIRSSVTRYKDWRLDRYSYRGLLRENFICQPAVFWRRDLWRAAGALDEDLHWAMDYDLWLRFGRLADPLVLDTVVAHFRLHRDSKTGRAGRRQFDEGYEIACRYLGDDRVSRWVHKLNVEKIVASYRMMRVVGW